MIRMVLLAALAMAYGWGYRGTVGHEAGAMVPGALLGLAIAMGSRRADWQQRGAVIGLFGAVGWAWGGSMSYMEHTFYVASDSLPDVAYGYSALFLLGALWAGCGGAILGLALTEPRSELDKLARVFFVVCSVFFVFYWIFELNPNLDELNETITVRYFHDGDWLSATITLIVAGVYWLARPKDRSAAALFFFGALGWWIGYGVLTQMFGLRLAPWHRSESWSGVLGLLIVLIIHLTRRKNHAAFMLCRYGIVGGGLAFALAVFMRHPAMAQWGPFAQWPELGGWRFSEVMFGLLMGGAMAFGVSRLARDLAPPEENTPRAPLDVFAVFIMLIALTWINTRRHIVRLVRAGGDDPAFLGLSMPTWFVILGAILSAGLLIALYRYLKGDRSLVPQSALGKTAIIFLAILFTTASLQLLDGLPRPAHMFGQLIMWIPASIAAVLTLTLGDSDVREPRAAVAYDQARWWPGSGLVISCIALPSILIGITASNISMQDAPLGAHARKRFGPDAYWQQTGRLIGEWTPVHFVSSLESDEVLEKELPLTRLSFDAYRNVEAELLDGSIDESHRWSLMNQYTWLDWHDRAPNHPDKGRTPLHFEEDQMLIQWPPATGSEGFLVFRKE